MAIVGRIQTGSYTNKDGVKVYTTEVVVEEQEFAESRNAASGNGFGGNYGGNGGNYGGNGGSYNGGNNYNNNGGNYGGGYNAGFMNIPDGIDEELPFA